MNRIFVANKPVGISSNRYLTTLKKQYKVKKAGFSGTLDPFASGVLIVAFGQYTKLFQYLNDTPKKYRFTIWLGAISNSFDNENVKIIEPNPKKINITQLQDILDSLIGEISYTPPKFSAKHINGTRAYKLARENCDFQLKKIKSTIYNINLICYNHPFVTIDISVSKGSYIRSIASIILEQLNRSGTLASLKRVSEGILSYKEQKPLDPTTILNIPQNIYTGDKSYLQLGKKLNIDFFHTKQDGKYFVKFDDFFSIIQIQNNQVKYILNNISYEKNYE